MQHIFGKKVFTVLLFLILCANANAVINCKSQICKAVYSGNLPKITSIIKANKKLINHKELYGISMLHVAIMNNDEKTTRFLIEKNADVNIQDQGGASALHRATRANFERMVNILLEAEKLDINIQVNEGYTPIMRAISTGRSDIIMLLIAKNPDCKIRNNQGKTMIELPMTKISKYAK